MKGQIRERTLKDGKTKVYDVVTFTGIDTAGKKTYKWVTCHSKREAQAMRAAQVHKVNSGEIAIPRGTFGEFIEYWLRDYAVPNLAPRTTEGYQSIYRAHISKTIGIIPLKNLKPEHIQRYFADKIKEGKSTTTVRHHAMMLHKVLEDAVKLQLLPRNPADSVTPPRVNSTEMHTLDESQIDLVLHAIKNRSLYYTLFYIAIHTGMRQSELLALRWQDIDLIGAEISVMRAVHRLLNHGFVFRNTKTARSKRQIAISPVACAVLRQHLDNEMSRCIELGIKFTNDRLIFCQWDGKPLIPLSVSQVWRRLIHRLGIQKVRFHDLRHTSATILLKAGVHPKIVQERLGHSSIQVTLDVYSHVTKDMQRQAVNAFDKIMTVKNR